MLSAIGELTRQRSARELVGRDAERRLLARLLEPSPPYYAVLLHGIPGIGKSALLNAFLRDAEDSGARTIVLDGRSVEPTESGFLGAVAHELDVEDATLAAVVERIRASDALTILAVDTYELLRLLDTWLRREFMPALPANARLVMAGREPPVAGWLSGPAAEGLMRVIPLGSLDEADALRLLERLGVADAYARRLNRLTRGHPLALRLAASGSSLEHGPELEELTVGRVVDELARLFLSDIRDTSKRRALEAASVVRRATRSLVAAMLDGQLEDAPADPLDLLSDLPFVETRPDGLIVHDAVREPISRHLRATDPSRHRAYRRAAWRQLRREVAGAPRDDLWRYTADMLYLIENPVVREAFFPSGAQPLAVEPARAADRVAMEAIAQRHDGPQGVELLRRWWQHAPSSFSVVRDRDGFVAGFSCVLDGRAIASPGAPEDPVVAAWRRHLRDAPVPRGQEVLGLRRWLDIDQGELPCAVQGAVWLDVKRTYMALRPRLRRMYVTVEEPATYLEVVLRLGFRPIAPVAADTAGPATLDGRAYTTVVLDFGPASVDGWLAGLAASELGLTDSLPLDEEAHEVTFDGAPVSLTPLEFRVLQLLSASRGRAVSRARLLDEAWGYDADEATLDDAGSNVVDVLVRRLRQKLGDRATIETVRGVGYRLPDA